MKTASFIASLSLLLATGVAMAQDVPAARTRADVIAELNQARAAGQLDQSEAAADSVTRNQPASGITRAQVRADVLAARADGTLDRNEAYESVAYMTPRPRNANVDVRMLARSSKGTTISQ
jgi:uncharacterized membrane protein YebE (DUF533 family)